LFEAGICLGFDKGYLEKKIQDEKKVNHHAKNWSNGTRVKCKKKFTMNDDARQTLQYTGQFQSNLISLFYSRLQKPPNVQQNVSVKMR
jgi:hypothetical protein